MKTKTLFTLYAVVLLLASGVAIAKFIQNKEEGAVTKFSRGYKPFEKLSPGEIAEVELKGASQSTTIKEVDGEWVVSNRKNYPAKVQDLKSLIRKINNLTVAQSLEAGESFNPRFGMDGSSSDEASHGIEIILRKADRSEITRLKLGKEVSSGGNKDPMTAMMGGGGVSGRFVRLNADPDSVYVINDAMNEAKSQPKDWLIPDFINVQNITSVSLSKPGKLAEEDWLVTRPDSNSDFTLDGVLPEGRELDTASVNALKSILSFAKFEDVVSEKAAEGLVDKTKTQRAIITTADGFSYTLDITPKEAQGTRNYLMTVNVLGEFSKERNKPEGEDPDIAKQADEDYAKKLKENNDKLQLEQSLNGRVFEVTAYTVQAFMKKRDGFFAMKAAPASAPPANNTQPRVTSQPVMFPGTGQ